MRKFTSHRSIIAIWPSVAIMARDLQAIDSGAPKHGAVNMWNVRGKIPGNHYKLVVSAANARGYPEISLRLLDELKAKP